MASLKLAKNSAWNLVALFATVCVHFITVPIVISRLGLGEFGNAGLVLAVWAPFLLFGSVIGQALTRELGIRVVKADIAEMRRITESAAFVWLVSTLAGGALLLLAGPPLLKSITGSHVSGSQWRMALAVAGVGWGAQQGSLMMQGASLAHQNYRVMAGITVVSAIASVVAILLFTNVMPDSRGYLAGLTAGFCVAFVLWLIVTRVSDSAPSVTPRAHRSGMHCLFIFGKWQGVVQFTGIVANQIDRYALGAMASPVVVGQYNAAKRPQEAAYSVALKLAEVLFPFFASTAQSDPATQARFYLFASWAVMTSAAVVLGPMIPLADPIMRVWVGESVANGGSLLMSTLVLAGLIGCGSNVFSYYLMGIGRNIPVAVISLMFSILTIGLSIGFVRHWGPYAAGMGLVVASVVRVAVSLTVLKRKIFRFISVSDLLGSTVVPLLVGGTLAYTWRLAAVIYDIHDWGGVALAYFGISTSIVAANCLAAAVTKFGRSALAGVHGLLLRILSGNVA